jgi:hypothetical protein
VHESASQEDRGSVAQKQMILGSCKRRWPVGLIRLGQILSAAPARRPGASPSITGSSARTPCRRRSAYQPATFPTPPFPDYVSGHSTYSAAAARILELWTGSDRFGHSVNMPAGSSKIEPGITPAHPVTLSWETFTEASDQAGMSRHYGGIQFRAADLVGRLLGRLVAFEAWQMAQSYFNGSKPSRFDVTEGASN